MHTRPGAALLAMRCESVLCPRLLTIRSRSRVRGYLLSETFQEWAEGGHACHDDSHVDFDDRPLDDGLGFCVCCQSGDRVNTNGLDDCDEKSEAVQNRDGHLEKLSVQHWENRSIGSE